MIQAAPDSSPPRLIKDVSVTTQLEGQRCVLKFTVLQSGSGGRGRVSLSGNGQSLNAALVFIGNTARCWIAVDQPRRWSLEDPFQYDAVITLKGEAGDVDRRQLQVGLGVLPSAQERRTEGTALAPAEESLAAGPAAGSEAMPGTGEGQAEPADAVLAVLRKAAARLDGKYPGLNRAIGFQLEGLGDFRLVFDAGRCRAESGQGAADATLRLKPEDALRLARGELNPMAAVMSGRVKVSGDLKTLEILQVLARRV